MLVVSDAFTASGGHKSPRTALRHALLVLLQQNHVGVCSAIWNLACLCLTLMIQPGCVVMRDMLCLCLTAKLLIITTACMLVQHMMHYTHKLVCPAGVHLHADARRRHQGSGFLPPLLATRAARGQQAALPAGAVPRV